MEGLKSKIEDSKSNIYVYTYICMYVCIHTNSYIMNTSFMHKIFIYTICEIHSYGVYLRERENGRFQSRFNYLIFIYIHVQWDLDTFHNLYIKYLYLHL